MLNRISFWRFQFEDRVIGFSIQARKLYQNTLPFIGGRRTSAALHVCLPEIEALIHQQIADANAKEADNWYWGDISESIKIAIGDARQIISSFHEPQQKTIDLDLALAALYLNARTYSRSALDEHGFITATILEIFRGISDLQSKLNGHCQFQSADIETGKLQCSTATLYWLQLECRLRAAIYDNYPYFQTCSTGHKSTMGQFKNQSEVMATATYPSESGSYPPQNTDLHYLSYMEINQLAQPEDEDTIQKLFWLAERMRLQQKKGWRKIMLVCAKSDKACIETVLAHLVLHIPLQVEYIDTVR